LSATHTLHIMANFAVILLSLWSAASSVRMGYEISDYFCKAGQGEALTAFVETGNRSKESCAALCDAHDECQGFDFTRAYSSHPELHTGAGWVEDSCRLYEKNTPRYEEVPSLTEVMLAAALQKKHAGWANGRQYCSRRLPRSKPTKSLQEGFSCKPGEGEPFQSSTIMQTGDRTFESCASFCDSHDECQSFDFTEKHSSHLVLWGEGEKGWAEDSCRLYKNNMVRAFPTMSGRTHCSKV